MKAIAATMCLVALASCTKQSAQEEKRYEIVKADGNSQAICDQARKVQDAYLQETNAGQYQSWKLTADIACNRALLDRANGL